MNVSYFLKTKAALGIAVVALTGLFTAQIEKAQAQSSGIPTVTELVLTPVVPSGNLSMGWGYEVSLVGEYYWPLGYVHYPQLTFITFPFVFSNTGYWTVKLETIDTSRGSRLAWIEVHFFIYEDGSLDPVAWVEDSEGNEYTVDATTPWNYP